MHHLRLFLAGGGAVFIFVLLLGLLLILLRKIESLTRAPAVDVILSLLTWVPWVAGGMYGGWAMLLGTIAGELAALYLWCFTHELMYRHDPGNRRLVKFINRHVGKWRNHAALWATLLALPVFWMIRFGELTFYWPLVWLLNFPRYKQSEWVNVSRQKFDGLIGHDLVWCLYCDWMTGVYSLGAEMLRNVESFWCPIRYYDGKKCDNCKLDFPDIANGWVPASGNMNDVERLMEARYANGERAWFGHPVRLTVEGKPRMEADERG